jgi:hypothetical protein
MYGMMADFGFLPGYKWDSLLARCGFHVGFYQIKSLLYEGPLVVFEFLS